MKKEHHLLVLVLLVYVALSVFLFSNRPFFQDEEFTYRLVTEEGMWNRIVADVHPPFYYYAQKEWDSLLITDNPIFMRIFGILVGVLTLFSFYLLISKHYSKRWALLATFVFSTNVYFLFYSTVLRMYSLIILFGIISWICTKEYCRSGKSHWIWLFFCVSILGSYTHYFFLATSASCIIFIFIKKRALLNRDFILSFSWYVILMIPLLVLMFFQSSFEKSITSHDGYTTAFIVKTIPLQIIKIPGELLSGSFDINMFSTSLITLVILILAFIFFLFIIRYSLEMLIQFLVITTILIILSFFGLFSPYIIASRHYLILIPFFIISFINAAKGWSDGP